MVTLEQVKTGMGITGNQFDAMLQIHLETTLAYLHGGGAKDANITAGLVVRGVLDLWNNGPGDGKFSPAFITMATQAGLRR